jgi:hypothetical protein
MSHPAAKNPGLGGNQPQSRLIQLHNVTHQRAGAIRINLKTDPTAGSVACDCSPPIGCRHRRERCFLLTLRFLGTVVVVKWRLSSFFLLRLYVKGAVGAKSPVNPT